MLHECLLQASCHRSHIAGPRRHFLGPLLAATAELSVSWILELLEMEGTIRQKRVAVTINRHSLARAGEGQCTFGAIRLHAA